MRRSPERLIRGLAAFLAAFALVVALAGYQALYPQTGGKTLKGSGLTVDASNIDQGYFMAKYTNKDKKKLKLRVYHGDDFLTYDLRSDGTFEVFPLSAGNGSYRVVLYKNKSGNSYSQATSIKLTVKLADENLPFLYPSQYVNYTADSTTVALSDELCKDLSSDREKFETVFEYLRRNVVYDHFLALTVKNVSGYLPDIDKTVSSGKGICFDYAAALACMLRVQGIPTRLCIGYADKTYHAWNSVYLDGQWELADATFAATGATPKQYTLERFY